MNMNPMLNPNMHRPVWLQLLKKEHFPFYQLLHLSDKGYNIGIKHNKQWLAYSATTSKAHKAAAQRKAHRSKAVKTPWDTDRLAATAGASPDETSKRCPNPPRSSTRAARSW
jgi:hypothetical protein